MLNNGREVNCVVATRIPLLPTHIGSEILLAKQLVHDCYEVAQLSVINAYEDHAVLCEQAPRETQAWIEHVQPVSVKPSTGLGVAADLPAAIQLACQL